MKWELLTYFIQICGLAVSFVGIIVLLRKEQSKLSTYLLLTNVGCLILNAGYLLLMSSANIREANLAYKVEYLGNAMFYMFFILFLLTFFSKRMYLGLIIVWEVIECIQLAMVWIDWFDERMYAELYFDPGQSVGMIQVGLEGVITDIRYGGLSIILSGFIVYTLLCIFRLKAHSERHNLMRLAGAEIIVLASLIIAQVFQMEYNIVPVAASCAVFLMIVGVIRGEFRVEDVGRSWLFEDMKDIFVIVDANYGYLDANASAKSFFPELSLCIKGEQLSEQLKALFLSEDTGTELGERHYVKQVVPIEKGNHVMGYSMLLSDITEQYALLEEIRVAKEKAEEANEAKSAFMSNMSHEIRTPMNAIVGMTDILLRSELPDRDREYLTNIRSSGEALLSIINDILDFSKIESGKMEIAEDNYDPMSMLNDLSMIFLNRIAEKPIELIFDIDKRLPAKLYGDGLRIRQVIINIVNNAIKFTDSGFVRLSIELLPKSDEDVLFHIKVTDSGQGIREEDISRLFGSYEQMDKQKNKYKEGTGLGLAISRQLVELMGGTIHVQSVYGEGSEFSFTIPQKVVNPAPAAEIKKEKSGITVGGVMRSSLAQEALRQLVEEYGLLWSDCNFTCVQNQRIDYFFTDRVNLISDELLAKMKEKGTVLCVVQNPMTDGTWDKEAVVLNKPLYTMNFCRALNNESVAFETAAERELNFTAPDARILIVDDNEMNLKVAMGLLEPLKMQIDTAGDGKQALDMIQCRQYDMVFMDYMMPVMDGIEAVQLLRQKEDSYFKNLPVVALTANAVSGAKEEFLTAGMNDFVAKPIRLKEITAMLRRFLPPEYLLTAEGAEDLDECGEDRASGRALCIDGIDVTEGILNCGSEKMLLSLLGDFYKLIEPKAVKIEKCLADGMLRDYTIEVHALKNTARMIGAIKLSSDFYRLEQLGNVEATEALRKETPEVLALYRSYKPILQRYAAVTEQQKNVDKQVIIEVLLRIKESMDCFDLDGADAALKELEGFSLPDYLQEKMELLRAYVADVAMEDVMALTEEMAKILKES